MGANQPISILIAEDDPGISRMMSLILKDEGFDVTIVSDGAEALKMVESVSPDVLLLDLRLPIVSGEEVATKVTQMDNATRPKIVITSASSRVSEIASNLGVDGFLVKPFEIDDLIAAARKVMGVGPS
jgi:two-component system response regulator RegX3